MSVLPLPAGLTVVGLAVAGRRVLGPTGRARRRLEDLSPGRGRRPRGDVVPGGLRRGGRRHGDGRRWPARVAALAGRFRSLTAGSEAEHADLLEGVARSLRAGASLQTALEQAAEVGSGTVTAELANVLVAVRRGAPLGPALDRWSAGDDPVRTMTGVALGLGAELGGARAQALDGAAASLRDRAALAGEIRALTSQARASAGVMVLAPVGFAAFSWVAGAGTSPVFTTPVGLTCLVAGLTLDALGAWWMAAWTRRVA